jgi:uncharacterized lipoprotein YajG
MSYLKNLIIILALAITSGCAFTDASLKVDYDEAHATRGPISKTAPLSFEVTEFADGREDTARIGYKRNGFGQKTADITTEQPVTSIVEDALRATIKHNGHSLSDDGQIIIEGYVSEFWFDVDVEFWTIRFMGTVESKIDFVDSTTNSSIYENVYHGYYEKETAAGLEGTWTEVMELALENMIDSIVKDPELAKALDRNANAADTARR